MFLSKPKSTIEFIIAGLGNPDKKYELTRHNAGFLAIDKLCPNVKKLKFNALTGEATFGSHRCLLIKPQTYMNNSGQSVSAAMAYYKIPPERLIVIYDDISLVPSKLRIRRQGSAGGHNGIKSIIADIDSDVFMRIKIGVGAKPHPDYDLADWVLSKFSKDELTSIDGLLDNMDEIVTLIVNNDIDAAMNKYNK